MYAIELHTRRLAVSLALSLSPSLPLRCSPDPSPYSFVHQSACSDTDCGNMATTSDWSSVAANTWTTYTTGYVTNQQLAMTNLPV